MKKSILLPALLFLFQIQVFPTIIIVDQSGGGNYTTIQEGINNASNGDTVLVYPGTYYENINYNGKNITVASLLLTTQDTIYISQTIINGNQNGSVVKFVSGEGLNSIIKGFTITNGFASYIDSIPAGGGIKCINSSPTIEKNIIKENNCDLYIHGGGIYCEKSSSHILNNTISNNEGAYYGGGIFVSDTSEVLIKGNVIFNNLTWSGYGIAKGGGIFCGGNMCYAVIEQNTICNNTVDFGDGGGICSNNASIVNTILWNNYPDEIAGQITITYSDVQGGWTGIGNIDADPLFADPANGDFHLTWANFPIPDDTKSPCIDTGDPASPLDPDSTIADMGA
ncbi:MAG: right-handed parallel beta-helix repeat-containing protein, partial [Bacteroidales bacterium]|nr:right-handed parallel beta-helix repeat-containing protein [Bacteroidales bacterium]